MPSILSKQRKIELLIANTNYCLSPLKYDAILRNRRVAKLTIEVNTLLNRWPYFCIARKKQSVIFDEDNGPLFLENDPLAIHGIDSESPHGIIATLEGLTKTVFREVTWIKNDPGMVQAIKLGDL